MPGMPVGQHWHTPGRCTLVPRPGDLLLLQVDEVGQSLEERWFVVAEDVVDVP
jgi:hypothetical protein